MLRNSCSESLKEVIKALSILFIYFTKSSLFTLILIAGNLIIAVLTLKAITAFSISEYFSLIYKVVCLLLFVELLLDFYFFNIIFYSYPYDLKYTNFIFLPKFLFYQGNYNYIKSLFHIHFFFTKLLRYV